MGRMKETAPDLFGHPPAPRAYARSTDPSTSHRAAASVDVTRLEGLALRALITYGPMISPEIAERTGIDDWSISPRLKPLEKKGLVERVGEAKRANGKGKMLTRWKATSLACHLFLEGKS